MLKYSAYIQHHIGDEIDILNSEIVGSDQLEDIYELAERRAKVAMILGNLKEYMYFIIPLPPGTAEQYNDFWDDIDLDDFDDFNIDGIKF